MRVAGIVARHLDGLLPQDVRNGALVEAATVCRSPFTSNPIGKASLTQRQKNRVLCSANEVRSKKMSKIASVIIDPAQGVLQ
jgi:hypothetical protein